MELDGDVLELAANQRERMIRRERDTVGPEVARCDVLGNVTAKVIVKLHLRWACGRIKNNVPVSQ